VTPRRADLFLAGACFAWGVSFVIVKGALTAAPPLTFLALRFGLAAVILAPFSFTHRSVGVQHAAPLRAGLLLAGLLGIGFMAQTAGLVYTTPSRSAFIVAMSSVPVPVVAYVFLRQRSHWLAVLALAVAGLGIYLLTAPEAGGMNRGDLLTLITAAVFSGQIVAIAELSRRHDLVRLLWLQTAGTAILAAVGALLLERPRVDWSLEFGAALGFTAVVATALALWWQLRAQRHMSSTRAALILCLEPVFAALTSWVWLGERLSLTQWVGGALILTGMVVADLRGLRVGTEKQPHG
jgi:drug/metabolite transporter (DMT)-like permease